jgi:hypothetical protein
MTREPKLPFVRTSQQLGKLAITQLSQEPWQNGLRVNAQL